MLNNNWEAQIDRINVYWLGLILLLLIIINIGLGYLNFSRDNARKINQRKRDLPEAIPTKVVALLLPTPTSLPSASPTPIATQTPHPTQTTTRSSIIINHNSLTNFEVIPDNILVKAATKRLVVRHASVGENINSGLNSLQANNKKYNRSNWIFQNRGNPGWKAKIDDLVNQTDIQTNERDVLTMKLCYIDTDANWDYYRIAMEGLMKQYPNKIFVWWTMPIMTTTDTNRNKFNANVRAYAQSHQIILFDIADIESHDPTGRTSGTGDNEAMYGGYSVDGGHLNSEGSLRVAKGIWVLMTKISG